MRASEAGTISTVAVRPERTATTPRLAAVLAFVAMIALAYGPSVFGPPFYTKGEPREAIVVQRMLQDADFVLPHRTPTEIPAKPPLFHWLGAAVSTVRGDVTEATVRLPSLAASLSIVVFTLMKGASLFNASAAWIAVVILTTTQQWIASSVSARVDMILAAAIAAAMFVFLGAYRSGLRWPDGFWFACALGVLAKGPVGVVLPVACVAVFLVAARDLRYAKTIRPLRAALLLAIPAFWYALAWRQAGDVFVDKVLSENLYRMVDADAGEDLGHRHAFWFYVPALLGGLAPWSLLLIGALLDFVCRPRPRGDTRSYLLAWLTVTVLFFSVAGSKRPVYLLSCYPCAALLMGEWLARRFAFEPIDDGGTRKAVAWLATIVLLAVGAACGLVIAQSIGAPVLDWVRPFVSPGDAANLFAVSRSVERHSVVLLAWAVCSTCLLAASAWGVLTHAWRRAFAAFALVIALSTAVLGYTVFRDLAASQSVKAFVRSAVAQMPREHPLYYYAGTGGEPDLFFYKAFEYATGFYARQPLTMLETVDVSQTQHVWFITTEATFAALRATQRAAGSSIRFRELARFTYDDNPKRTPVVFVHADRP